MDNSYFAQDVSSALGEACSNYRDELAVPFLVVAEQSLVNILLTF